MDFLYFLGKIIRDSESVCLNPWKAKKLNRSFQNVKKFGAFMSSLFKASNLIILNNRLKSGVIDIFMVLLRHPITENHFKIECQIKVTKLFDEKLTKFGELVTFWLP